MVVQKTSDERRDVSGGEMIRPVHVEARQEHRIWLRYSDGTEGEVDLSDLAGRGVFKAWDERGCFEQVRIAPHRAIVWDEDIELCPDALYMELTGSTSFEELPDVNNVVARDA